jgi:hypothetical protein
MEHPTKLMTRRPVFLMLFLSLFSLAVWGQDQGGGSGSSGSGESSTTTTTKTSTSTSSDNGTNTWYTSPWVWVVGAAVFILLLVALLSNRGRDTVTSSDRVHVTKTVEKDRGPDA